MEKKMEIVRALTGGEIGFDHQDDIIGEITRRLGLMLNIEGIEREMILTIFCDWMKVVIPKFVEKSLKYRLYKL